MKEMSLNAYLFKKRVSSKTIARRVGCSHIHLVRIIKGQLLPGTTLSENIARVTKGLVKIDPKVRKKMEYNYDRKPRRRKLVLIEPIPDKQYPYGVDEKTKELLSQCASQKFIDSDCPADQETTE